MRRRYHRHRVPRAPVATAAAARIAPRRPTSAPAAPASPARSELASVGALPPLCVGCRAIGTRVHCRATRAAARTRLSRHALQRRRLGMPPETGARGTVPPVETPPRAHRCHPYSSCRRSRRRFPASPRARLLVALSSSPHASAAIAIAHHAQVLRHDIVDWIALNDFSQRTRRAGGAPPGFM